MCGWGDARVLVTGASGFIGSHLIEALVCGGAHVRAFLRGSGSGNRGSLELVSPEILDDLQIVLGDLRDAGAVRRAARGVSTIFHLGALAGIPYSRRGPRDMIETNVLGTLNVLEAAREHQVGRVLHTSTCGVYGISQYLPIDEAHPLRALSPYAASKIGADRIAESFHRSFGVPVSIVRPFNVYGPRQSARTVVPAIVSQALAGGTIRLGLTTPTRDLTFVTDLVTAFLRVAHSEGAIGQTLNVGTGRETSVGDVVAHVGRILTRELIVETDPQRIRPGTSVEDRVVADATRARALCGWAPKVALEDGLVRTVEWTSANLSRFRAYEHVV